MKGDFLICNNHQHSMVIWNDKDDSCPLCKAKRDIKRQGEMIDELTSQAPDTSEQALNLRDALSHARNAEVSIDWVIEMLKRMTS